MTVKYIAHYTCDDCGKNEEINTVYSTIDSSIWGNSSEIESDLPASWLYYYTGDLDFASNEIDFNKHRCYDCVEQYYTNMDNRQVSIKKENV